MAGANPFAGLRGSGDGPSSAGNSGLTPTVGASPNDAYQDRSASPARGYRAAPSPGSSWGHAMDGRSGPMTLPPLAPGGVGPPMPAGWGLPGMAYRSGPGVHRAGGPGSGQNTPPMMSNGPYHTHPYGHGIMTGFPPPPPPLPAPIPRLGSQQGNGGASSSVAAAHYGAKVASPSVSSSPANDSLLAASTAAGYYRRDSGSPAPDGQPPHQGELDADGLNPPPLRRNQACVSCRKRKLKCDAVRPVCGTCQKSREAAAAARHPAPVPAGDCQYNDGPRRRTKAAGDGAGAAQKRKAPETNPAEAPPPQPKAPRAAEPPSSAAKQGGAAAADAPARTYTDGYHIAVLEQRIRQLEKALEDSAQTSSGSAGRTQTHPSPGTAGLSPEDGRRGYSKTSPAGRSPGSSTTSGKETRWPEFGYRPKSKLGMTHSASSGSSLARDQGEDMFEIGELPAPIITSSDLTSTGRSDPDPLLELLWPGWPSSLPNPEVVLHLSEIFFARHHMRNMIYKPDFMSSLNLPPRHPDRPHIGLLHAVMAAAAPLSPYFQEDADGSDSLPGKDGAHVDQFLEVLLDPELLTGPSGAAFPFLNSDSTTAGDPPGTRKQTFAEYHLMQARKSLAIGILTQGNNPVEKLQAMILIIEVLWNESRLLEGFLIAGILSRTLAPLGLLRLLPYTEFPRSRLGCFLAPPKTAQDEHERRMTLWMAYSQDACFAAPGNYFEPAIGGDDDITTSLPSSVADFQSGKEPLENPQTLHSDDLFETGHVDDFALHVKACIITKRVKALLARHQCCRETSEEAPLPKPPGFDELDRSIELLMNSMPPLEDPSRQDLVSAKTTVLGALALLYEPFCDISTAMSPEYKKLEYVVKEM